MSADYLRAEITELERFIHANDMDPEEVDSVNKEVGSRAASIVESLRRKEQKRLERQTSRRRRVRG